jgi:N-acetylmuramoyl-L-alanine amidase
MKIAAHKLADAEFRQAHSFGGEMKPTLIVVHDTAGRLDKFSSVNWFCSQDCNTSAHVVIERDGTITQQVAFNRKAWHAGASTFKGQPHCNNFAIGIEIVNPGKLDKDGRAWFHKKTERGYDRKGLQFAQTKEHGTGWWMPYTHEQIAAVTNLCKALVGAYDISDITAHFVISPGRKIDTNPLFPLDEVRRAAFAVRGEEVVAIEPVTASADIDPGDLVSRTIRDANVLKWVGGGLAGGAAAKGAHDANVPTAPAPAPTPVPDISLDGVADQIGILQRVMDGVGSLSKLVVEHYWVAGIIAGAVLYFYGRRIIAHYIDDIRTGKREPIFKITKQLIG